MFHFTCKSLFYLASNELFCKIPPQSSGKSTWTNFYYSKYLSTSTCFISMDLYIWDILPSLSSRSTTNLFQKNIFHNQHAKIELLENIYYSHVRH